MRKNNRIVLRLRKSVPIIVLILAGILAFNTICGGRVSFVIVDIVVAVITAVYVSAELEREKEYYDKFHDAFDYMEQLSFAFVRTGQVAEALEETKALFDHGKMKETLAKAVGCLGEEFDMTGRREALAIIEKEYPISLMVKLHDYMVRAENYGGDVRRAIAILKNEQYERKLSVKEFAKQLGIKRRNCIFSCLAGALVSGIMVFFVPDRSALLENTIYQFSLMIFTILSCVIIAFAYKKTVIDFLADKKMYSDEQMRDKLRRYISGRGFLNRIVLKKIIGNEVRFAFTEWILAVTLLLESHNVEGAIEESLETAPYCMKPYLLEFMDKVRRYPGAITPYTEFLEDFSFSEVKSSMRLLYSLSAGVIDSVGDAISHLIEQNLSAIKGVEEARRESCLAGMSMMFMMPVALTSLKLIADMSVILIYFITKL